jgi:fatty acid desaturase
MQESFENRPLLDRETLRALQERKDLPSVIHLVLQLCAFAAAIALVVYAAPSFPIALPASILLGAIWTSLFAPFHECIHQTAFRSRRLNAIGGWLSGVPFGMAPAVYRDFHFEHHRHTHDPARDPEMVGAPSVAYWPTNPLGWLWSVGGLWLIWLKVGLMFRLAMRSVARPGPMPAWVEPENVAPMIQGSRIIALAWSALLVLALLGVRGAIWLLVALIACHVFQSVWLTSEHTGLQHDGTILARTRTTLTSPLIAWWLWNMNYHAEHHAWPAIPWHALPAAHRRVASHVEHQSPGYWRLQMAVLRRRNLPDGVAHAA